MSQRKAQLQQWLRDACGIRDFTFAPASGDASFRRYFRVGLADGGSLIAMDAPPDKEDCKPFVDVTGRLAATGVHVPQIQQQDLQHGFLLLEDLGNDLYLGELDETSVDRLYGDALAALVRFQVHGDVAGLPPYDRELLAAEMALFPDWLLGRHLGLSLDQAERRMLDESFELLIGNALVQPRVLVHRDYHSRNLLVCAPRNPGIIDYQDAVHGPLSYDLVSLLRDCYIRWPGQRVDAWLQDYAAAAVAAGLLDPAQQALLPQWFDLMGVQRHLKAAGIFARLKHRDGKPGYLGDIPRTLGYIVEVAQRRAEIAPLAQFIAQRVLPVMRGAA
jgi:aminoglycoside/choline kinase family phosphotransferase